MISLRFAAATLREQLNPVKKGDIIMIIVDI
jgi:hypothetical protein